MMARDHHGLADIERAGRAQIRRGLRDIGAVALRRLHAAERTVRHQDLRRDLVGAEQPKAVLLEQIRAMPVSR